MSGSFAVKTTANAPTPISSLSTKFLYEKIGSSLKSKSDLVVPSICTKFPKSEFYFNGHAELFSFLFQLNFTRRFCYISGISLARDIYYRTTEVFGCVFHPTNFTVRFCYISGVSLAIDSRQVHVLA